VRSKVTLVITAKITILSRGWAETCRTKDTGNILRVTLQSQLKLIVQANRVALQSCATSYTSWKVVTRKNAKCIGRLLWIVVVQYCNNTYLYYIICLVGVLRCSVVFFFRGTSTTKSTPKLNINNIVVRENMKTFRA